jgi:protein-tyrosine phosphatase
VKNEDLTPLFSASILYDLIAMGALTQVTGMSLTGQFGLFVQKTAQQLISQRLIHIIASDAHSADNRPPVLSHAVDGAAEILGSDEEAGHMVTTVPAAILAGEEIVLCESCILPTFQAYLLTCCWRRYTLYNK